MYKKLFVLALALVVVVLPVAAQPFVHEFPQNFINHIMESYGGVPAHGTIFEEDGTPTVAIILGERALPHDVVGATLLGFKIGTHLYYWRAPDVDGSLLGDRYVRKAWIEDWAVIYDRYDLLTQTDPLDGGTAIILFSNASVDAALVGVESQFEEIYCVDPGVNYWIAPQSIDNDGTLHFMVGYKVSAAEMDIARQNGMIVLPEVIPLDGACHDRDTTITYTFVAGTDYDAKAGTTLAPGSVTWIHSGFQFSWPPYPMYLNLDQDYKIPWLGYTVVLESITVYDTDGDGVLDSACVEFVLKDEGGNIIDVFRTWDPTVPGPTLDLNPTTMQRYWYSFDAANMLKIELDLDRDGDTESVLAYFYVEIWDVDYDHDLVECQFFSSYFAPPIAFEGWVNVAAGADLDANEYLPATLPAWGDPSWALPPRVLYAHLGDLIDATSFAWVYAEGIDTPEEDASLLPGAITDYGNAEDYAALGILGANDVAVLMEVTAPSIPIPEGQVVVGEFDVTSPVAGGPYEKLTAFYIDWWKHPPWTASGFWYDKDGGIEVAPGSTTDGIYIVGWTFYGHGANPHCTIVGAEAGEPEEFIWIEANMTWPSCEEIDLPELPTGDASGDVVFWGPIDCPDGPCVGDIWTFYRHRSEEFARQDCAFIASGTVLNGYDWDGAASLAGVGLVPDPYHTAAADEIVDWWYNTTLHVYNVTGFHAGIYDSFNCLPGTAFTGTAHVDPVTGAITWGPGGADQYYEGEDVFSFIKTPLAYIDTQVFDGTTLSDDVIDKDLILVGGPHVNSVVDYLNDSGYLYLYYVEDKLFYPADIDPATGEPNYYDLAYALGLTGITWPEENIPKYTTGLGAIQFTAKWNGATGPSAAWDTSDSDPWGDEVGSVENWILVVAGTDRFGTYAASVALADPTKIIYETAPNFCNTSFVIVIGVTPYAVAPPAVPGVAPVVMVLVGTTPGVTPIGVGVGAGP